MGRKYAKGSRSVGYCDRCGFEYPLGELKPEVVASKQTENLTCVTCFDPDNPQMSLGGLLFPPESVVLDPAPDLSVASSRELAEESTSFVAPNTNTITDYGPGTEVDETVFRTSAYSVLGPLVYHRAMVRTSNSEMLNALGPRFPEPFRTVIISAKLKVGAYGFGQTYTNRTVENNTAYRIIEDYDPGTVNWNSFGFGGTPETQYTAEGSVEGVRGDVYVEWDFTEIVNGWLSGSFDNYGLFFPETGTDLLTVLTYKSNVVWTVLSRQEIS